MKVWKSIAIVIAAILAGILIDLYVLVYAERWAAETVGQIGTMASISLLFVPKLMFGLVAGYLASRLSRKVGSPAVLVTILVGAAVWYCWKFFAVETWIAPEALAYLMALGPYGGFFVGFLVAALFSRRLHRPLAV
jgi:hypothetical protein